MFAVRARTGAGPTGRCHRARSPARRDRCWARSASTGVQFTRW